ncbi:DUF2784 domain-containing protein [Dactylosporangium sp. NPDC051484]|uniref:DUF2784 domain-containing protein n=1 Tax=Dactylosporangium sp. NPDC051484 TaxID=3154942 RepID=UPI00344EC7B6
MYAALATTVLVLHFCFLAYVVLGGFLVWRWPKAFWPHLAAAAWGLAVVTLPLNCPLTAAEHWARRRAGQSVSDRGFIDTYIQNVLYPARYTHLLQVLVGVIVIGSYAVAFVRHRHRRAGRKMSEPPATV